MKSIKNLQMAIALILENPEPNLSRTKYLNNLTNIGDSSPSSKFLVKCCLGKGICSIEKFWYLALNCRC